MCLRVYLYHRCCDIIIVQIDTLSCTWYWTALTWTIFRTVLHCLNRRSMRKVLTQQLARIRDNLFYTLFTNVRLVKMNQISLKYDSFIHPHSSSIISSTRCQQNCLVIQFYFYRNYFYLIRTHPFERHELSSYYWYYGNLDMRWLLEIFKDLGSWVWPLT